MYYSDLLVERNNQFYILQHYTTLYYTILHTPHHTPHHTTHHTTQHNTTPHTTYHKIEIVLLFNKKIYIYIYYFYNPFIYIITFIIFYLYTTPHITHQTTPHIYIIYNRFITLYSIHTILHIIKLNY